MGCFFVQEILQNKKNIKSTILKAPLLFGFTTLPPTKKMYDLLLVYRCFLATARKSVGLYININNKCTDLLG